MNPKVIGYFAAVVAAIGMLYGAYAHGVSVTDAAWQDKWDKQALKLADDKANAEEAARAVEQQRITSIEEITNNASKEIESAKADAAAANSTADRLRNQAARLAATASHCSDHSGITTGGKTTTSAGDVLSDVLSRADKRAGELAAAYDQSRAAGLACERAYDTLINSDGIAVDGNSHANLRTNPVQKGTP